MITFDKALCKEIMDFARANAADKDGVQELSERIVEKLYEIEREDDMNGANELGRLLYGSESKSIASIAREHGLVPDVSHELSL